MTTIKKTKGTPSPEDAHNFASLYVYSKIHLLKKMIVEFIEEFETTTPDEANSLLVSLAKGESLMDMLRSEAYGHQIALLESLEESEKISKIWEDLFTMSHSDTSAKINIEEAIYGLYDPNQVDPSEWRNSIHDFTIDPAGSFPWIQPKSWGEKC